MSANSRWYVPTPAKYLLLILLVQGFLVTSAYCQWFELNQQKGLTVVITFAVTCLLLLLLAGWLPASRLLFKVRPQFSLATLMFTVLVAIIPCTWLANECQRAREQHELVAKATSHGYTVSYDKSVALELLPNLSRSGVPQLLHSMLGDDFFAVPVDLTNSDRVDDRDLEMVGRFKQLESLWLFDAPITDAGLAHLKGLSSLQELYCVSPNTPPGAIPHITDDGLAELQGLHKLQILELDHTYISDAGLEHLIGCTELTHVAFRSSRITDQGVAKLASRHPLTELGLSSSLVTDAGLENLKHLTLLKNLDVSNTSVSDAGLAHLKGHTNLVRLDLEETNVTDAGLAELAAMKQLVDLDLGSTALTDTGLLHLKGCKELMVLDLSQTAITDAGIANLLGIAKLDRPPRQGEPDPIEAVEALTKSFPHLRRLAIRGCKVTDLGLWVFQKVYPRCAVAQ